MSFWILNQEKGSAEAVLKNFKILHNCLVACGCRRTPPPPTGCQVDYKL